MRFQHLLYILLMVAFTSVNANNSFKLKTVVIDAGHGGKDPGAQGPGKTNEKDIALIVALKLGDYIQKNYPDVNVIYTRKTDVFLELHERAEIANKNKADLFIAVHINSSTNPDAYGTSCYVLGLHRTEANLEVAKRENAVINLEEDKDKNYEFDPNSPEGHIIMSMKQNAFLDQSIDLASKVESQMENYGKRKSLGVKQAGFYVLYKTTMPSILAEVGFISNPEEEKFLNSIKGQDLIATSLFNAFKDYKFEMENSEGEQFVADQGAGDKNAVASIDNNPGKTTTDTQPAGDNKTAEVKTDNKTTTPPAGDNKTPGDPAANKPTTNPVKEQPFVTTTAGTKIRKPIENASGGGKATKPVTAGGDVEPIYVKPSNLDPFDTTSMSSLIDKQGNPIKGGGNKDNKTEAKNDTKADTKTVVEPANNKTTGSNAPEPEVKSEGRSPLVPEHKAENGVVFKIQLFALKGGLKEYDKVAKLFTTLSAEELPNGFTRYYGGDVKTYAEAKKLLDVAKGAGYNAAFIVGFKNGNRMSADDMKAME